MSRFDAHKRVVVSDSFDKARSCTSCRRVVIIALVLVATVASLTDILVLKVLVPISAGGVVATRIRGWSIRNWRCLVIVALLSSGIGDIFMSNLATGGLPFFFAGVLIYLAAHLAYTVSALLRGRFRWSVFLAAAAVVGTIVFGVLLPAIENAIVAAVVFAYAVVSAVSLGAAAGIQTTAAGGDERFVNNKRPVGDEPSLDAERSVGARTNRGPTGQRRYSVVASRRRVTVAITLIIVSDVLVSRRLFLDNTVLNALILPTYFAAHLVFAWDALVTSTSA